METKEPLFDLQKTAKDLIESNNHVNWSRKITVRLLNNEKPVQAALKRCFGQHHMMKVTAGQL